MLASEGVGLLSEGALCALVEDDELSAAETLVFGAEQGSEFPPQLINSLLLSTLTAAVE